jgi:3-deoxy-D-manno-octulosonic-acid transferase
MIWWVYNIVFPLVFACMLPHYLLRMLRRGGYAKDFMQRFGCYGHSIRAALSGPGEAVWIQAVSVGELGVALTFMEALRKARPGVRFVLTTNTSTGYALAKKKVSAPDVALYFPLDTPPVMKRVFRRIAPKAVVLVENEMWPNLIRRAGAEKVPVAMVNGRISAHSYKGYRKVRFLTRRLLPGIGAFCVQSGGDGRRLVDLGAPEGRVEVTGSAKYDISATPPEAAEKARRLVVKLRPEGAGPVVVGGSTWPGEEEVLLDWAKAARAAHPGLLLVLVPRHAERRAEVLEAIAARGMSVAQRSKMAADGSDAPAGADVLLVDTTGELRGFYAAADAVFVGKSLTQTGGQNPVEPAKDGRAVAVGPHMENFPAISEDFREAGAWAQVDDAAGLGATLDRWLAEPGERDRVGAAAAALVAAKAGATAKMAARVSALMDRGAGKAAKHG